MDGFVEVCLVWTAFVTDIVVGDPAFMVHPVVIIGRVISRLETHLRCPKYGPALMRATGAILVVLVVSFTYGVALGILYLSSMLGPIVHAVVWTWMLSTTLAVKGLNAAGLRVATALEQGSLVKARAEVGQIVGRDTQDMDEEEVSRAAVETIAENASDGVIAPMLYGIIGGPALAMAYKAINTLDSMIGYKNERYLHFGWAAARLDDFANLLPARLTGLFFSAASVVMGRGFCPAFKCMMKFARHHPSPNGGYPESAVAGCLRVQLGGVNRYGGIPSYRAKMGYPIERLGPDKIRLTGKLLYLAAVIGLAVFTLVKVLVLLYCFL